VSAEPPWPGVSVVVPTHARPELMARAVRSALAQRYAGPLEVLVVFDACEPVLPEVDVVDGRSLRAVVNGRTRGLAGARNTGILASSHPWVAFLDDDDHWAPEKLALQLALVADHPDAVLVGSAIEVDDGRRRHRRSVPAVVTHGDLILNRLAGLHSSSFVVRRSALLGPLGLVDEGLPRSYAEDYDLLLRAAELAPIRVVDQPLVTVSWQGRSHFLGRWGSYADALELLLRKHPGFAASRRGRGRLEAQIAFARAAQGQRRDALRWTARALRTDPRRLRAWLAAGISAGVVHPDHVAAVGRRFGRGL
jgi:GT2 family glycosyltransferase